jgi:solute carrier family 25 (mitochondrial folate transporter), member 32
MCILRGSLPFLLFVSCIAFVMTSAQPLINFGTCPPVQANWSPFVAKVCNANVSPVLSVTAMQLSHPGPSFQLVQTAQKAAHVEPEARADGSVDAHKATRPYPWFAHAIAGAGGGLTTVLLLHPLDTVKTRLQSDSASRSSGALRMFRSVVATQGVAGLYRGAVPAMVGSISSWAFYMQWFHTSRALISQRLSTGPSPWTDFAAGTTAGLLTAVMTNPIWVVKVRLQLQQQHRQQEHGTLRSFKNGALGKVSGGAVPGNAVHAVVYSGFLDGIRCIARDEGLRGLYKGLGPSLWLVSHGAIQFTLYEHFKRALSSTPIVSRGLSSPSSAGNGTSVIDSLVASTASKLVAAAATYPIQLVRTRMQELGPAAHHYRNLVTGVRRVIRSEGVRGLYRGFGANVARVVPQSAVTFVTYEQILKLCILAREKGLVPGS